MKYSIVGQKYLHLDPYLVGITPGTPVELIRQPDNPVDPGAVGVWIDGKRVGYLRMQDNVKVGALIDVKGKPNSKGVLALDCKFARSPNSAYPQVTIEEGD